MILRGATRYTLVRNDARGRSTEITMHLGEGDELRVEDYGLRHARADESWTIRPWHVVHSVDGKLPEIVP